MHLASPDISFELVDDDVVEENNIQTSAFFPFQIGVNKSKALANLLYRKAKCTSKFHDSTMVAPKTYSADLAIDCFDNVDARRLTTHLLIPTLHVGVSRDGTGSMIWDEVFNIFDGAPRGEDTFCTHLAGKDIIRLTAVIAAHVIQKWLDSGEKESIIVTDKLSILR